MPIYIVHDKQLIILIKAHTIYYTLECFTKKVWHVLSTRAFFLRPTSRRDLNMAAAASSSLSAAAPIRDSKIPKNRH